MSSPYPKLLSHMALSARGGRDPQVVGLTADSRAVRPGFLFAALLLLFCLGNRGIKVRSTAGFYNFS